MHLVRENWNGVAHALEAARASNFEVRNTPVFHLLKARLLDAGGQTEEAVATLEEAMQLPGVRGWARLSRIGGL